MRQLKDALRRARVSARRLPRTVRELGAPSPAFVAMQLMYGKRDMAVELRDWQAGEGSLWRRWKKLGVDAKAAMAGSGRRLQAQ